MLNHLPGVIHTNQYCHAAQANSRNKKNCFNFIGSGWLAK